jgi:hypothetical protein
MEIRGRSLLSLLSLPGQLSSRNHRAARDRFNSKPLQRTVCRLGVFLTLREIKLLRHNSFLRFSARMHRYGDKREITAITAFTARLAFEPLAAAPPATAWPSRK